MDKLKQLAVSLSDLSYSEQLELIEARRTERATKPFRPVRKTSTRKKAPKIIDPNAAKKKAFEKVDGLLEGKSLEEIMEIAKRLGVKK